MKKSDVARKCFVAGCNFSVVGFWQWNDHLVTHLLELPVLAEPDSSVLSPIQENQKQEMNNCGNAEIKQHFGHPPSRQRIKSCVGNPSFSPTFSPETFPTADSTRTAMEKIKQRIESGCQHLRAARIDASDKHGSIVMVECPDCGLAMGIHPEQAAKWESQFPQ